MLQQTGDSHLHRSQQSRERLTYTTREDNGTASHSSKAGKTYVRGNDTANQGAPQMQRSFHSPTPAPEIINKTGDIPLQRRIKRRVSGFWAQTQIPMTPDTIEQNCSAAVTLFLSFRPCLNPQTILRAAAGAAAGGRAAAWRRRAGIIAAAHGRARHATHGRAG